MTQEYESAVNSSGLTSNSLRSDIRGSHQFDPFVIEERVGAKDDNLPPDPKQKMRKV